LLNNVNVRKEKIIAMYDARERVYKNGKEIKITSPAIANRKFLGTLLRAIPNARQNIKSKYPPKVLGSPTCPSKGALTLMPWGICIIP
jgi:hypothetical protein